ncbi:Bug family tripartite tricarboxylate transporter substrate binding protein [Salinigranum rubrum]|uniref:Bug family tripartite tricarboxylate transporter substrate binding protein n=1 Tax=Salinigranum rubrum TaxID=755307 RepID=UPI0013A589F2|nr:tripartite tricarboxylate transporter substrate binding protein [Salinigranum rubrum]
MQVAAASGIVGLAGCTEQSLSGGGEYPSQEIRTVVPWSAGGGTDQTVRQLVNVVEDNSDHQFVVENVTGASGTVGQSEVLNAEPDGYTIGLISSTLCILPHIGLADFAPTDFTPIFQYNSDPRTLIVHEDTPYGSLEEFQQYASENPSEVTIGPGGLGNIDHLAAAGLGDVMNVELNIVPYAEGAANAIQATLNGEVHGTTVGAGDAISQIEDGPLEVLGVMGNERLDILPDTPTFPEAGYEWEVAVWRIFVAPPDMSQERAQTLYDILNTGWETDEYQSWMSERGYGLVNRGPDELPEYIESQFNSFEEPAQLMETE